MLGGVGRFVLANTGIEGREVRVLGGIRGNLESCTLDYPHLFRSLHILDSARFRSGRAKTRETGLGRNQGMRTIRERSEDAYFWVSGKGVAREHRGKLELGKASLPISVIPHSSKFPDSGLRSEQFAQKGGGAEDREDAGKKTISGSRAYRCVGAGAAGSMGMRERHVSSRSRPLPDPESDEKVGAWLFRGT